MHVWSTVYEINVVLCEGMQICVSVLQRELVIDFVPRVLSFLVSSDKNLKEEKVGCVTLSLWSSEHSFSAFRHISSVH